MSEMNTARFPALEDILIELRVLAADFVFDPQQLIPRSLKQLPPMPEVKRRLLSLADDNGGVCSLAVALPTKAVWQWEKMLKNDDPWGLSSHDFSRVCAHFHDPVLYYLIGKEFGTTFKELDNIPLTCHYMPTLSWTLRRYLGEIQFLMAKHHAAVLNHSKDEDALRNEINRLTTETFVLLKQIELRQAENRPIPLSP